MLKIPILPTKGTPPRYMSKILIALSLLFLTLSAVFGVLNTNKARSLRDLAVQSDSARAEADRIRLAKEKEIHARETKVAEEVAAREREAESKIASSEADLIKSQSDKAELQTQLQEKEQQIADLQKRLDEGGAQELMPDSLPMPGAGDLASQLEDTRRQLDEAEREKQLLADKVRAAQDPPPAPGAAPQRRRAAPQNPGVRGTVLAVNQAYNFVVLSIGGRHGVEPSSEMLVLRSGALIGKIRVSSVEPATAIGDIISNSLARGVQVQPGDVVIYAGTNS